MPRPLVWNGPSSVSGNRASNHDNIAKKKVFNLLKFSNVVFHYIFLFYIYVIIHFFKRFEYKLNFFFFDSFMIKSFEIIIFFLRKTKFLNFENSFNLMI